MSAAWFHGLVEHVVHLGVEPAVVVLRYEVQNGDEAEHTSSEDAVDGGFFLKKLRWRSGLTATRIRD
jgi:hypothetical protein